MNMKPSKFAPQVRDRAIRLVREQRSEHSSMWAPIESIARMIGCTPQTLLDRVKRDEVERGYRGAEIDGVTIWRSGQKRGVTRAIKAMIHRRSAIEPTIGHMKTEGKLDRNWFKGTLGDAVHAVLCSAGHNLRLMMNKVRSATPNPVAC